MNTEMFNKEKISVLYMKLSLPLVLAMVISLVYNLADTYFVAATNNTNLVAGVSLCAPVFTFLMALGNIFGQGGASLISRLLGEKRSEDIRKVSSWCFYTSLLLGFAVAAVMLLSKSFFLKILGTNADTYMYAGDYYTWLIAGSPIVICNFVHSNLLRTEGLAKDSMIGTIGGSVVNIILDPIFILVLGLGAAGAAIATLIGYTSTILYNLYAVKKRSTCLSVAHFSLFIKGHYLTQIVTIGFTAAITNIMQSFGIIFLNQALVPYGNDCVAAMGIAMKIAMIVMMVLIGLAFGGQPMCGYYYGAKDKVRLKQTISFSLRLLSVVAIVMSLIVFLMAPQLFSVFIKDAEIVAKGTVMLRLQVLTMIFVGQITLITNLFQSTGKALPALILSISRQGVVFVIMILMLSRMIGYYGVLAAQPVADLITETLAVILYCVCIRKEIR